MLQVLRRFTVAMRGAGEKLPGTATVRERAWNLPPHLTERPPSPPHRDSPGALTLPWDYFANSFLLGFDCLEGKIGSWFFGVFLFFCFFFVHGALQSRTWALSQEGEERGGLGPGFPTRQAGLSLQEGALRCLWTFLSLLQTVESERSHGFLLFLAPPASGCPLPLLAT